MSAPGNCVGRSQSPHVAKMLGACHIGKNPFVVHELAEPLVPNHVNAQSWEPLLGWALGLQYLHERELGYKNFENTRLLTRPHVTVNGVLTGLGLVPIERQTSALLIRRAVNTFSMDALTALLPRASADDNVLKLNSPRGVCRTIFSLLGWPFTTLANGSPQAVMKSFLCCHRNVQIFKRMRVGLGK